MRHTGSGADGELLGDHAAKGHPDHGKAVPAKVIGDRERVCREVCHRRLRARLGRDAAPEPAVVIDDLVEAFSTRPLQRARQPPQVAARATDLQ